MNLTRLRILLAVLSGGLIAVPIIIVGITDNGFGALTSHILISLSILSAIAAVLLGLDPKNKNKTFFKICVSIGLFIVMLSLWL